MRQVHHLADLLRVRPAERPAEDREVLREDEDLAPVDRAVPVTTPSPRTFCCSIPKSVQRCVTKRPISMNEPGSRRRSMRSRAVSLPPFVLLLDALLAAAFEYARGEFTDESDVDVLILLDRVEAADSDAIVATVLAAGGIIISPLIFGEAELQRLRDREKLIAQDLDREGISL
jgi:hypothetical protein